MCFRIIVSGKLEDKFHHDRRCPISIPVDSYIRKQCTEYKRVKVKTGAVVAKYRDAMGIIREIREKAKFKKKCVRYENRNHTKYHTTYNCCPGWTGPDCKQQYLTLETLQSQLGHYQITNNFSGGALIE